MQFSDCIFCIIQILCPVKYLRNKKLKRCHLCLVQYFFHRSVLLVQPRINNQQSDNFSLTVEQTNSIIIRAGVFKTVCL